MDAVSPMLDRMGRQDQRIQDLRSRVTSIEYVSHLYSLNLLCLHVVYKYGLATGETKLHLHPLSHAVNRGEEKRHAVAPVTARGVARERDRPVADAPQAVTSGHAAANDHTAAASVRPVDDARLLSHAFTRRHALRVSRSRKRARGTSLRRRRRNVRRPSRPRNASRLTWSSQTPLARTTISNQTPVSARTHCRLVARFFVTSSVRR